MSTHVTIAKKPSGHNLKVTVLNPGAPAPSEHVLADNQAVEVLVYGAGQITMAEVEKEAKGESAGRLCVELARAVQDLTIDRLDQEFELRGKRMRVLVEPLTDSGGA